MLLNLLTFEKSSFQRLVFLKSFENLWIKGNDPPPGQTGTPGCCSSPRLLLHCPRIYRVPWLPEFWTSSVCPGFQFPLYQPFSLAPGVLVIPGSCLLDYHAKTKNSIISEKSDTIIFCISSLLRKDLNLNMVRGSSSISQMRKICFWPHFCFEKITLVVRS